MISRRPGQGSRRANGKLIAPAPAPALTASSVSGCALFLMGDAGMTSGATFTWSDSSGNARHYTQSTAINQPTISTGINGVQTMQCANGGSTRQFLLGPSFSALTSAEAFMVCKPQASPALGNGHWKFGGTGNEDVLPYTDGNVYDGFGTNVRKSNGALSSVVTPGTAMIYNVWSAANDYASLVNGVPFFSTTTNTVAWDSTGSLVGSSSTTATSGGITYGFSGPIGAMIIYDHKLSSADRAIVMSGLRAKFATP